MPAGLITPTAIQTDWRCNSGTTVASLTSVIAWSLDTTIENYLVQKRLTMTLPLSESAEATVGRVVRLDYRDASTTPPTDDWEEYRITDRVDDLRAGTTILTGVWWIQDLLERDALCNQVVGAETRFAFTDYAVTPSTTLTARVIAALPGIWSLGTVTPITPGDVAYARSTPMAGALAVAAMAKRVTGVTYELWPSRNGTSGLYLNLSIYGAGTIDVRPAKNLINARRTERRHEQSTRMAFDADLALQRPTYRITAISAGAYIEVKEVNDLGPGPAREDDQWIGSYWYEEKNNTSHQITDVVKVDYATTRLSMASTTGMNTGERGFLASNSSAADIAYVDSPSLQALYGKRLGILAGGDPYTNYIKNGDLRNGTATTPTDFSLVAGTPARKDVTTGLVRYGGYSYDLSSANAGFDQTRTIYAVAGEVWTYTCWLFISTFGAVNITFKDPQSGADTVIPCDGTDPALAVLNTHIAVSRSFNVTSSGAKTFYVKAQRGASGAAYIDAFQLTRSAEAVPFRVGSGAADNIALANAHADTNGNPIGTFDIDLADLALVDPRSYGDDRAGLGVTAYLTSETLDETRNGLRIVAMTVDSRNQANPRVQLSTLPRRLTALLAA